MKKMGTLLERITAYTIVGIIIYFLRESYPTGVVTITLSWIPAVIILSHIHMFFKDNQLDNIFLITYLGYILAGINMSITNSRHQFFVPILLLFLSLSYIIKSIVIHVKNGSKGSTKTSK